MKRTVEKLLGRRGLLKSFGAAAAAGLLAGEELEAYPQNVNRNSKPSELRITDMRIAWVTGAPMSCPLVRLDTNQGISGLGEVRDGASKTYALMLKSRLLGENPCNVDKLFRKIKQFGGHARQGGGVSGVEMALWDLAGKAYGVPVYQMLGGKFRDRIRLYADTAVSLDPKEYARRMKMRLDTGFTWLKMDLGIGLVAKTSGTLSRPLDQRPSEVYTTQHMFTGIQITDKGIAMMADYVAAIREAVGYEVPLAADHFGHIGVNSCIRLGKALEKFQMAWLEDMIPWQYTDLLKQITASVDVPILTGEDIYLKEPFAELVRQKAVDLIQPDLATAGGILETKKIGDLAIEGGVGMVMHFAGTPVSCMANVHCAAATENFLCLENHSVEVPWWQDLVTGIEKPIVDRGYIKVPETPGLGVELNPDEVKKHIRDGYFDPTPEWDRERSNDRLWS
jgi:L-alanine-DL-glutamate epimerase-like enolase superfamily enzyme